MKVCDAIISAMIAEDCGVLFGVMGDGTMPIWAALGPTPSLPVYSARHEAASISMAEGYARMTGRVAVATVTCGPGLTHIATPLVAAARRRTPIVVVAGDLAALDRHNVQKFDQRRFAEACEARFQPLNPDFAAEDIREAFHTARSLRCPVVLNVPVDVQAQDLKKPWVYSPSHAFAPAGPIVPTAEALEPIVAALIESQRPVILAGRGAALSDARDEIAALADRAGALLATSALAKDMFIDHPFDVGIAGGFSSAPTAALLREADFVLAIGAGLNYYTAGEADFLFPKAKIARIDIAQVAPGLNHLPGLYAQGDARAAAALLRETLERRQVSKTGFRTPATQSVLREDLPLPPRPADGLDPRRLMRALSNALPEKAMVATGSAHFWTFPMMYLALPQGGSLEYSGDFGEIGSGVPLGIGTAVATPDRAHVVIEGDGSIMQHLQELETVVRCGLQVIVVVMNDAGFGAEVHKMRSRMQDSALASWSSPDFVAIARAMGGDGVLLKAETEIGEAVAKGLKAGGLYLIDARVSPTTYNDRYGKIFFGVKNTAPLLRRGRRAD